MFEEGKLSSKMKDSSIIWSEKNQPSFLLAARGVFMGAGEGGLYWTLREESQPRGLASVTRGHSLLEIETS